jgi:glutathione synthase/RimK-type ligase-like ATP-grasp enzyme
MKTILVVDDAKRWSVVVSGVDIVESEDFFTKAEYQKRGLKVFNLCRSYGYQSSGYYVSLLASARAQKVVPTIETILDMQSRHFIKLRSDEIDQLIQSSLKDLASTEFEMSIYFGKNINKKYDKLCQELHKSFEAPMMRARFKLKDKWRLLSISPIGLQDVPHDHFEQLNQFALDYLQKRQSRRRIKSSRFDMAILHDPGEIQPPSNEKALQEFVHAANRLEIDVDFITKEDFHRIPEFDGLFIRETTGVNHHTFRFAHKAKSLGMVVIDDPLSILRCANKVYLAELFQQHKIPAPKTQLLYKGDSDKRLATIQLPTILKVPDSSFSRGVFKIESLDALKESLRTMFAKSDIVIAQEFIPTEFDWRVGILDGKALYVCKYFMARNHWQIIKPSSQRSTESGRSQTFAVVDAPVQVVELALKAARLIGNGLYGVDIKEVNGKLYLIEINDNPSIDATVEDLVLKKDLYDSIMRTFRDRMERIAMGETR